MPPFQLERLLQLPQPSPSKPGDFPIELGQFDGVRVGNSNRVHSGSLASTSFGETLQQERRIRSIEEHTTNRVVKGHSSEALYVTQGRMGLLSDLRLFSAFTCLHPIIIFAAIDIRP